ncbi:hypothetical protein SAMN04488527_103168 [Aliiroseovarius crassostreae]|uniref:Uncharacterized protein n=1 Tax=Aliiroseovarius crassostreae TaxID=154981 RepID=A0A0P7ISN0_9RHOB|nr:hypothetical protein [Aliiroseovarius crassostreae]KPN61808.1 hypothetical protein AKJ29_04215 [Aliiroseovarius crassostreae]SFU47143.1 hypothetical protein SAMN04488527_103168 [Aliiroseovarius crassostreae]
MKRLWVLMIVLLTAQPGIARDLAVRSGEHDQFTRLVVYTQQPSGWKFGRVPGGYELRLATDDVGFDLSRAFNLIPRSRIKNLEDRGSGTLFLDIDCQCYADVFIAYGGQIVVDIRSGKPGDESAKYEAFLDQLPLQVSPGTENSAIARLGLPLFPRPQSDLAKYLQPENEKLEETQGGSEQEKPLLPGEYARDDQSEVVSSEERVTQTELALIEQIGRAAAQGLVDANLSTLEAEVDRITHPIKAQEPDETAPVPDLQPVPTIDANDHIAVQTSIDRETSLRKSEVLSTQEGFACIPDTEYDIATWGGDVRNGAELAKYASLILGEFDQPNPDMLNAYIRHQLYLTFGAEAMLLAREFPQAVGRPEIIQQIAEVMDWHKSANFREFAPQMGCDGKTALWAALAQPEFRPGQEINQKAIILSFSELPLHLRRHLGPDLAQKFLAFGDAGTANALRNLLDRAEGDHGPSFNLLEARLELQSGAFENAEHTLTQLVNDDSDIAPVAALEFVNSRITQDQPVPERFLEILSTYAFEQRDLPLGADLKSAEIRARVMASDFNEAFVQMKMAQKANLFDDEKLGNLQQFVFSKLEKNGSDAQFLRYVSGASSALGFLDEGLKTSLSARLSDLGFSSQARALLDTATVVPDPSRRLVYATIALLEGKSEVALGYLAGLETPEANLLRAQAWEVSGDFDAAAEIYRTLGETEKQVKAELRGGDWDGLSQSGPVALKDMGRLISASSTQDVDQNVGSLARNASILTESAAMRTTIENLLTELPHP